MLKLRGDDEKKKVEEESAIKEPEIKHSGFLGFVQKYVMAIFLLPTIISLILIAIGIWSLICTETPKNGVYLISSGAGILILLVLLYLAYLIAVNEKRVK